MKRMCIGLIVLLTLSVSAMGQVTPVPDVMQYQGTLTQPNGTPLPDGTYSVRFSLWDAPAAGTELWNQTLSSVEVRNSLASVFLTGFLANTFHTDLWLEIKVGTDAPLTPRQPLVSVPYAFKANRVADGAITADSIANGSITSEKFALNVFNPIAWLLGGNSGINPASHFLGTTDNQPLVLKVNNQRVFQMQYVGNGDYLGHNLLGGFWLNSITTGVTGATVFGGGRVESKENPNRVTDHGGTVSGGFGNRAGNANVDVEDARYATVGGGATNKASNFAATVGGGYTNFANGSAATVGGGYTNVANNSYATISGGRLNNASGAYAIIGGGYNNSAIGGYNTISGGSHNSSYGEYAAIGGGYHNGTSGPYATVSGGYDNGAYNSYATISGGRWNSSSGDYGTIGGGQSNIANGQYATVGGGYFNFATVSYATISGGYENAANGLFTIIGGGYRNRTSGSSSSVGGGQSNTASYDFASVAGGYRNTASGIYNTIGGGIENIADGQFATIAGGGHNTASGMTTTVGGGSANTADNFASTVGGGYRNSANGGSATVGGGQGNTASRNNSTVGGGTGNTASGDNATVGGGASNTASGRRATVPGGISNTASGDHSFAAGFHAKAKHEGSFVWADRGNSNDDLGIDFASTAANQFNVRATGGVRLFTNLGLTAGVTLDAGGGTWNSVSDRNAKTNFQPVDVMEVLEKLAALPLTTWNYKANTDIRHIGAMAQDFYAAFGGLGVDDKHISTVDADGVAFAAIQGLNRKLDAKEKRLITLEAENAELKKRQAATETENAELKARLEAIETVLAELKSRQR